MVHEEWYITSAMRQIALLLRDSLHIASYKSVDNLNLAKQMR